jgi:hypothetical protein
MLHILRATDIQNQFTYQLISLIQTHMKIFQHVSAVPHSQLQGVLNIQFAYVVNVTSSTVNAKKTHKHAIRILTCDI